MADPDLPQVLSTEADVVSHPPESSEDVDAATGDDVHDKPRSAFPLDARFTDAEWACIEAARADLPEEG